MVPLRVNTTLSPIMMGFSGKLTLNETNIGGTHTVFPTSMIMGGRVLFAFEKWQKLFEFLRRT